MKEILSGNEAFARGAHEAAVKDASAYREGSLHCNVAI